MSYQDPIVIVSAARTPIGAFLGQFAPLPAPQLGKAAIRAVIERSTLSDAAISEVIMGCVLSAGIGQAPARQAALYAGLLDTVPCTTINKMCGSSMQAVIYAHDRLLVGSGECVIAGGLESMSLAPYLAKARTGYRFGHDEIQDHMLLDGLEDAYDRGKPMGYFAEMTAKKYQISRERQDHYALLSLERAQVAHTQGYFKDEITAVQSMQNKATVMITQDEGPQRLVKDKIPTLPPIFMKDGTVTAANSSSISDGAAALLLMRLSTAEKYQLTPLAKIIGHQGIAQTPAWFTTAPAVAIEALLKKIAWRKEEVDLYEINEAFAVVALCAMDQLSLEVDQVNVHGGACALGHPLGATGARILVTLLYALKQRRLKRGIAALCIGGGEATAVAIEMVE